MGAVLFLIIWTCRLWYYFHMMSIWTVSHQSLTYHSHIILPLYYSSLIKLFRDSFALPKLATHGSSISHCCILLYGPVCFGVTSYDVNSNCFSSAPNFRKLNALRACFPFNNVIKCYLWFGISRRCAILYLWFFILKQWNKFERSHEHTYDFYLKQWNKFERSHMYVVFQV